MSQNEPVDTFNWIYILCVLLGVCVLFPYNAFITATDYFGTLFPDKDIETFLTICTFTPNLLGLIVTVIWPRALSFQARIKLSFVIFFLVLLAILVIIGVTTNVSDDKWKSFETTALIIILVIVCITGFITAVFQGSIFGFTAMLPPRYTQAAMSGNAIGGMVISFCRIFTKLGHENPSFLDIRFGTLVYFCIAAGVVTFCLVAYLGSMNSSFIRYYVERQNQDLKPLLEDVDTFEKNINAVDAPTTLKTFAIIKIVLPIAIQVALVFTCTLSLFPAIIVKITSQYADPQCWTALIMITLFNTGDFIGRGLSGFRTFLTARTLWIPIIFRFLIFVPLLSILAHFPGSFGAGHNIVAYATMLLFAISNGYCGSLAMMFGPGVVEAKYRDIAGTFMVFCLTFGLALGSILSLPLGVAIDGAHLGCTPVVT